jgi:hypothetical protein
MTVSGPETSDTLESIAGAGLRVLLQERQLCTPDCSNDCMEGEAFLQALAVHKCSGNLPAFFRSVPFRVASRTPVCSDRDQRCNLLPMPYDAT